MALGQSSLAQPSQQLQAPPPTVLVVGGQMRRGGRKVKSSWVKAEFERKEMQQDGKTTVEYSCLHCQRTLTGLNATQLENHLLNPGACKFLYCTSEHKVAKQVAKVEALQTCRSQPLPDRGHLAHTPYAPGESIRVCVCACRWLNGWVQLQACA